MLAQGNIAHDGQIHRFTAFSAKGAFPGSDHGRFSKRFIIIYYITQRMRR
jgi:hypothetical protein